MRLSPNKLVKAGRAPDGKPLFDGAEEQFLLEFMPASPEIRAL
jgi:hypothetical protein